MRRRSITLGLLTIPFVTGCRSWDIEETTTANGVVETIDPRSRELLLRGAGGAQSGPLLSMVVGQRVQNIERVRPGDRVNVTYYQGLMARMARPLSSAPTPGGVMALDRTAATAPRPGGEATRVLSGRITVTNVDPATNTISFLGPNGVPRTVTVQNPEVQAMVRSLRRGDQVDVVYEEALAIAVEPMRQVRAEPVGGAVGTANSGGY
ncbi:hypothetical protein [Sabulicella rubraurantiaca]|uniref:hypothetical protein n=1 Tax=Sabulicella rubraurantiaca TaxID=2811429 RepID=UPI001A95BFE0|nr:hypothetical protein [Sabulicella rubraurantiaca]